MSRDVVYINAEEDDDYRRILSKMLRPMLIQLGLTEWHIGDCPAGTNKTDALLDAVSEAGIVLLLVTPDYLVSPLRHVAEPVALARGVADGLPVCPVHVRAIDPYHHSRGWLGDNWKAAPFGQLAAVPSKHSYQPVLERRDRDVAWVEVASALRTVLTRMARRQPTVPVSIGQPTELTDAEWKARVQGEAHRLRSHTYTAERSMLALCLTIAHRHNPGDVGCGTVDVAGQGPITCATCITRLIQESERRRETDWRDVWRRLTAPYGRVQ